MSWSTCSASAERDRRHARLFLERAIALAELVGLPFEDVIRLRGGQNDPLLWFRAGGRTLKAAFQSGRVVLSDDSSGAELLDAEEPKRSAVAARASYGITWNQKWIERPLPGSTKPADLAVM